MIPNNMPDTLTALTTLTPEEYSVLQLLADAQTPPEIASVTGCKVEHISYLLRCLRNKYQARNTEHLAVIAVLAMDVQVSQRLLAKWATHEVVEPLSANDRAKRASHRSLPRAKRSDVNATHNVSASGRAAISNSRKQRKQRKRPHEE